MRKFLLALVVVAVAAMPAFASVQNLKVSGAIDSTYVSRSNFDFGSPVGNAGSTKGDLAQSFAMTQATVKFDADLTDNVSTTLELINERVWGTAASSSDNEEVDVNLAYVTLREMLYSPLTLVVGRQQFAYGNSLVLSSAAHTATGTPLNGIATDLSKQTGFDAIRAILDYNPLKIELFAAKITETNAALTSYSDLNNHDKDLYGADAVYAVGDKMNTQVEGYFFSVIDKSNTNNAGAKTGKIYTPGVRVSLNPIERLNLQAEYAHQFGTYNVSGGADNRTRNANAAQFLASYKIPVLEKYAPVAKYAFTFVQGDVNGETGSSANYYTGWDSLYENQGYINGYSKIYNAMFSLTNLVIHEVTFEMKPVKDITASVGWSGLWLNTPYDSSSNTLTATYATYTMNPNKRFLGNEFDGTLTYDYTEDVKFGATIGMFVPGKAFINANNDDAAQQAMVNMQVAF
ncbi:MAG: alginate export family protein [Candidatus Omnitrophica bacterium]|nr:alginate export family protein [Candidatus Omnitrophota bacterium]